MIFVFDTNNLRKFNFNGQKMATSQTFHEKVQEMGDDMNELWATDYKDITPANVLAATGHMRLDEEREIRHTCTTCAEYTVNGADLEKLLVALLECNNVDFTYDEMRSRTTMFDDLRFKLAAKDKKLAACEVCATLIHHRCPDPDPDPNKTNIIREIIAFIKPPKLELKSMA